MGSMGRETALARRAWQDSMQDIWRRQLQAYADGRRHHEQMGWIAKQLDPRERKAVSFYYAGLAFDARAVPAAERLPLYHEGDPSRGLQACAACHGEQGQGLGAANPPLADQPPAYLAEQLNQWSKAKRRNDPGDVMLRISQLLTPSERAALATYAAKLSGRSSNLQLRATSPQAHRDDPRNGASGPPLHVPESARAAE